MRGKGQKYGGNSGNPSPLLLFCLPPFTQQWASTQYTLSLAFGSSAEKGGGEFSYSVGRHLPRGSAAGLRERAHSGRLDAQYELSPTWREFRRHSWPTGERKKKLFLELAPYNSVSLRRTAVGATLPASLWVHPFPLSRREIRGKFHERQLF